MKNTKMISSCIYNCFIILFLMLKIKTNYTIGIINFIHII